MTIASAQSIIELNKSKEYTLTATPILEKVLTDNRLSSPAAKLWQFLFSKSKYDHELSISISYSKLASLFEKSSRTISRWIKSLENAGYLLVQHNYDNTGSQIKNTLFVRIPQDVFQYASEAKDRHSKNSENTTTKSTFLPVDTSIEMPIVIEPAISPLSQKITIFALEENKPNTTEIELKENFSVAVSSVDDSITAHEAIQKENIPHDRAKKEEADEHFIGTTPPIAVVAYESVKEGNTTKSTLFDRVDDKNVMGEGDNSGRHIILVSKDIINNNSAVVVCDDEDKECDKTIRSIENDIANLKNRISDESMTLKAINQLQHSVEKRLKLIKAMGNISDIDRKIHFLEIKKETLLAEAEKSQEINKKEAFLSKNITSILNLKGERAISQFTFKRLVSALSALGYAGKALTMLVNEIVFEVRFGSLKQGINHTPLNTEKAVNIGIKLVREKRWFTPNGLQDVVPQLMSNV